MSKSLVQKKPYIKDLAEYNIKEIYDLTGYPTILDT